MHIIRTVETTLGGSWCVYLIPGPDPRPPCTTSPFRVRDFVWRVQNRDWNVARKRTAQGLFADDQAEDDDGAEAPTNQEGLDRNGYHPRKRMHRDGRNYDSQQGHPAGATALAAHGPWTHTFSDTILWLALCTRAAQPGVPKLIQCLRMTAENSIPIRSRITFQGRDGHPGRRGAEQPQYDPFNAHGPHASHNKRHHENHQQAGPDGDNHQREYDRGAAAQPLRPYNRAGQLPRNGRSGSMHDRQHAMPPRRDRERSHMNGGMREQEVRGDGDAGPADAMQEHDQTEEGELAEGMPGPPGDFGRPAVRYKRLASANFAMLLSLGRV